eukprot:CAMPEP_0183742354 /NCGR_PEP_ID=MMETSP0737-20130205/64544_1 /TAXON_ID=385413 /ORGANISM="Thalassiosira miniscula, Strain CCMP1093" /LENGTH=210 /DNA_ID=CAMNT_0025977931 /DNA_START=194 /DNA_END=826 /DNA_ORIENTATION=-
MACLSNGRGSAENPPSRTAAPYKSRSERQSSAPTPTQIQRSITLIGEDERGNIKAHGFNCLEAEDEYEGCAVEHSAHDNECNNIPMTIRQQSTGISNNTAGQTEYTSNAYGDVAIRRGCNQIPYHQPEPERSETDVTIPKELVFFGLTTNNVRGAIERIIYEIIVPDLRRKPMNPIPIASRKTPMYICAPASAIIINGFSSNCCGYNTTI